MDIVMEWFVIVLKHKPQVDIGLNVTLILGVLWMLRHLIRHPLKVYVKKNKPVNNAQWLFEAIEYPIKFLN
ncbi:hypothetical protein BK820_12850 [Acinetobacter sp. LCT-H3]|nr:hypothetical protein BK820_12850 [Acinetobacter sp. LCT-H3]